MAGISSNRKVASVKRFTRRSVEDPNVFKPTETVKIGFVGSDHPDW